MYVFTLWNQSPMPEEYAQCVAALLMVYPSLVVERFESPDGEDVRTSADYMRVKILADATEPTLYLDADCLPGPCVWEPIDRPAAMNFNGGILDVCVLYTPGSSCQYVWKKIVSGVPSRLPGLMQVSLNREAHLFDRIAGYPDNRYFTHKHLGGVPRDSITLNQGAPCQ